MKILQHGDHVECPHCANLDKTVRVQEFPRAGIKGERSAFTSPCERCDGEFTVTAQDDGTFTVEAVDAAEAPQAAQMAA